MNPFFDWLIKSSLSIAILYIVFKLAVSRDKIFTINRFVLLGVLAVSAVLPLTDIPVFRETVVIPKIDVIREFVATPVIPNTSFAPETVSAMQEPESMHINLWMVFYLLVILTLLIRLLVSVVQVLQIIRRAEKQPFQNYILAVVKDFIHPFSFLRNIIISEKDFTENKDIVITHEYAHIKHFHAVDLLVCELFTALHWFNPLMWLLRHDLKLIHEYQADQAVLNKGIDAKKYQLLVLEKAVGERRFAMANHFTQKPILKRIKMMHRKNENYWKGVKLILFAPVILLLLQAFARPEVLSEKIGEIVPSIVQKDSSEIWLDNWVNDVLKNGSIEAEPDLTVPTKSGVVKIVMVRKNFITIKQNSLGELMIDDKRIEINQLENIIESFIKGKNVISSYDPDIETRDLNMVGLTKIPKGSILYRGVLDTQKPSVKAVIKAVAEGYLNVRKEFAIDKFGVDYFELSKDKKEVVNQAVPIRFTILEPKTTETSQLKPPPPPPPPNKIELTLKKDGKVLFGKEEYSISGIEQKIIEFKKERTAMYKKWNMDPELVTSVKIEVGVTDAQVNSLKEALRRAKALHINYSTDFKESEWKDQSSSEQSETIKPPPPPMLWLELSKNKIILGNKEISLSDLEKEAKSFMGKVKNQYLVRVSAEYDVSKEEIETVTDALKRSNIPSSKILCIVDDKQGN